MKTTIVTKGLKYGCLISKIKMEIGFWATIGGRRSQQSLHAGLMNDP